MVTEASTLRWTKDTVVLLAVKGQDTEEALTQLVTVAPQETPIVCVQNGVENERRVLRRFPRTYAMCVHVPGVPSPAGVVVAHSAPVTGLLDLGRYPCGVDDVAEAVAAGPRASTFESVSRPDIMRWKYRKLIMNLTNAIEALSGPDGRDSALAREARREGEAVLHAAGVAVASVEEDRARRADPWGTAQRRRRPARAVRAGKVSNGGPGPLRRSSSTARLPCSAQSTMWIPR